jgi:hypothetical protein
VIRFKERNPETEREKLTAHICEFLRRSGADLAGIFHVRRRLEKTRVEVLRQIVEEDVVNVTAAQFLRTGAAR